MPEPGIRELLQAGLHFGHQTRRWNPRMRPYIYGEHDGIHIIDLLQTEHLLAEARRFAAEVAGRGGTILFVGTKKQARDSIKEWADRCGMPYVNQRWLGGLLTNFHTMSQRIDRLHELRSLADEGQLDLLPTKERMAREAELEKLEYNLGGVRDMKRLPDAVFIVDLKTEAIAVAEAKRLRIPIIGLVDTNVDPVPVDFPVPGNDDAIRSCSLVISTIGEAVEQSATAWREAEAKRRAEEEERRRREEEERRRREEEERARREAEEAAKAQAEAAAQQQAAQQQAQQRQQAQQQAQQQQQPKKPARPRHPQAIDPDEPTEQPQQAEQPAQAEPKQEAQQAEQSKQAEDAPAQAEAPAEAQPAAEQAEPAATPETTTPEENK
jgi:small subunit ribosomal protein S2